MLQRFLHSLQSNCWGSQIAAILVAHNQISLTRLCLSGDPEPHSSDFIAWYWFTLAAILGVSSGDFCCSFLRNQAVRTGSCLLLVPCALLQNPLPHMYITSAAFCCAPLYPYFFVVVQYCSSPQGISSTQKSASLNQLIHGPSTLAVPSSCSLHALCLLRCLCRTTRFCRSWGRSQR